MLSDNWLSGLVYPHPIPNRCDADIDEEEEEEEDFLETNRPEGGALYLVSADRVFFG